MVLDILEISQKQAYIFSSNQLRGNVISSEEIAWVTSSGFFKEIGAGYSEEDNLVYAGGGHTILQFETEKDAQDFNRIVTRAIVERYPRMEAFAKVAPYDEEKSPRENVKDLIALLEVKKSMRRSSFKKGSYGIEEVDPSTRRPREAGQTNKAELPDEKGFVPEGYIPVFRLEELGGTRDSNNFIAVVHIDGNGMGSRVSSFQEKVGGPGASWDSFMADVRKFSASVDDDFKAAYRDMAGEVAEMIRRGVLDSLSLEEGRFPVRRIITSGDDICYVAEGRIGIETARIFLEKLGKRTNKADGKGYDACAGVALVHAKFPFFRAYELAEALCSNAKSFGAGISPGDNGASVSSIDWHIEYGEMGYNLPEIRGQYATDEGKRLEMRPYIVNAPAEVLAKEPTRQYGKFKKVWRLLSDDKVGYARSNIKELRSLLRKSEPDVRYFLTYHKIEGIAMECYQGIYMELDMDKIGTGKGLDWELFMETSDGRKRSTMFDAIEVMDTFICLDWEGQQ